LTADIRHIRSAYLPIAALNLMLASACGSPLAEAPPVPRASTDALGYRISGRVADGGGAPVPGAHVVLDDGQYHPHTQRAATRTDGDGRYELFVRPEHLRSNKHPGVIIRAYTADPQYTGSTQLLDGHGASAVKNFCLRGSRTITAGGSTRVAIHADSSLCDLGELSTTTICEIVRVHYPKDGTLTIAARGSSDVVPTLRIWRGASATGALSIPVSTEDMESIDVAIAVPVGMAPQRYDVSTSLR
jgi:hypothetical protein